MGLAGTTLNFHEHFHAAQVHLHTGGQAAPLSSHFTVRCFLPAYGSFLGLSSVRSCWETDLGTLLCSTKPE